MACTLAALPRILARAYFIVNGDLYEAVMVAPNWIEDSNTPSTDLLAKYLTTAR
jgi:hypothetical protein